MAASFSLRPASIHDQSQIRSLVQRVQINPLNLRWQKFILAINNTGGMIGCGQIKTHKDGSLELASIAVAPEWRSRGVAHAIIEHLLHLHVTSQKKNEPLYLTCRAELGSFYHQFGFEAVQDPHTLPVYFRRISRFVSILNQITGTKSTLLVMRRNK